MIITLLTDYGLEDEFVGVCHGVIARICPDASVIDIAHGIPRHDVRRGALVLRNALPHMPVGVHVSVVDPGVGTERRALALRCADGRLLVGPDNGLMSLAWQDCGGVELAVDVSRSPHRLDPVSATFHGRDVFAPVGAQLARGAELAEAGEPLDPTALRSLELPAPRVEDGALVTHVVAVDRFGNAALGARRDDLAGIGLEPGHALELEAGGERHPVVYARTFADAEPGALVLYEDSFRSLAVAINQGDAARALELRSGSSLRLRQR